MHDIPVFDEQIDGLLLDVVTDYAIKVYHSRFDTALEEMIEMLADDEEDEYDE